FHVTGVQTCALPISAEPICHFNLKLLPLRKRSYFRLRNLKRPSRAAKQIRIPMQDNKLITNIIEQFLDLQQGEHWLDENFRKKTADLDENQVFERPLPELHSVAELISHILVWRLESIRKIQNSAGDLSADSSESWKTNEQLREIGWRRLRSEFYKSTDMLVNI